MVFSVLRRVGCLEMVSTVVNYDPLGGLLGILASSVKSVKSVAKIVVFSEFL